MKILLIHQYFLEDGDFGGSRFNEMTAVWKESDEVTILAGMIHANGKEKKPEYKGKWIKVNDQNGVTVIRSHIAETYNSGFLGRLWGYFSFMISSLYAGLFKATDKYDVILVTSPPLFVGITGVLLSKIKRIPLVFEIRDLWPESAIDTGVLNNKIIIKFALWVEGWIYKHSSKINVLTPAFEENLIQKKGIPKDKIFYIPNACDFRMSDELLKSYNRDDLRTRFGWSDKFVITYVGAHGVANHLDQIILAAKQIKNPKVIINLIGDGMQKEYLKQLAINNNVSNIVFMDPVPKEEVFKYIIASDVGASILKKVDTFKTIFSNKTFDYMSCKRPVLLLIDGISRKLIEDSKCGFYAEPENIQEIAREVDRISQIPEDELKVLGLNGYRYAKNNFDRSVLSHKYLGELRKVK